MAASTTLESNAAGAYDQEGVVAARTRVCITRRPRLGRRGRKGEGDQALGRSRGGYSSKLHALADGLGDPLRFTLTRGQAGDAPQAIALLEGLSAGAVVADRADDSHTILAWVAGQGAVPMIPPHPTHARSRATDWSLYKERSRIEIMIGMIRRSRRVSVRFDRLARPYLAFVHLAAACILLG
jgi:transposase